MYMYINYPKPIEIGNFLSEVYNKWQEEIYCGNSRKGRNQKVNFGIGTTQNSEKEVDQEKYINFFSERLKAEKEANEKCRQLEKKADEQWSQADHVMLQKGLEN